MTDELANVDNAAKVRYLAIKLLTSLMNCRFTNNSCPTSYNIASHYFLYNFFFSNSSLSELEKDFGSFRVGLRNLRKEHDLQKLRKESGKSDPEDQFVAVMSEFLHVAEVAYNELEEKLEEAKKRVSYLMKLKLVRLCEERGAP